MTLDGPKDGPGSDAEHAEHGLLGRIGPLQTRIVRDAGELRAAQRLRYDVFAREFGGVAASAADGLDADTYDAVCDHLIVLDTRLAGCDADRVVGTYRLLRQERVTPQLPFYSAATFDLPALVDRHPERNFLELGRSCVLPDYRSKRTIELLWQGIWAYCRTHHIDVMTGCASFPGMDMNAHATALSFLHHHARASGDWTVRARPHLHRPMNLMPAADIDLKTAMRTLPPLIKGYLRLGATFGDGAVIDTAFRSVDVLVVLPVEQISARYLSYYGVDAARFAA